MLSLLHYYVMRFVLVFFLTYSYCAESLYFWLDVEDYQHLPHGSDFMIRTMLKIHHKYIESKSNMQVNISDVQRNYISDLIQTSVYAGNAKSQGNRYIFKAVSY